MFSAEYDEVGGRFLHREKSSACLEVRRQTPARRLAQFSPAASMSSNTSLNTMQRLVEQLKLEAGVERIRVSATRRIAGGLDECPEKYRRRRLAEEAVAGWLSGGGKEPAAAPFARGLGGPTKEPRALLRESEGFSGQAFPFVVFIARVSWEKTNNPDLLAQESDSRACGRNVQPAAL
ncbi:UNVERIFIED_CONTAM: hypothetical protein K2H54_036000 [Gekko kuhli]